MTDWYHGSPERLTVLLPGSTISQDRELAEAFAHRPTIVSDSRQEGGPLEHNGTTPGFLYRVDEWVDDGDVQPVPESTMPGNEWLTTRPLRVTCIRELPVVPTGDAR
ncbi:MAG TPA: hypothetical protein VFB58_13050 [Chloroflexota bacterium]|nr:hypothetical protein [Chloroflexota bacterium]